MCPSSSSISPTFVPSATEDQSEPEPAPALFASIPTMSSTPSHVHSAINNFASTPPSSSPTSSTCLPTVTEEQPEPEPEPIPLIAPASTFASTPLPSSSSTFLPTPVISATDCQPTSEPASASPVSKFDLTLHVLPLSPDQKLDLLPRALSPPPGCLLVLPISSPTLSSLPLPEISSLGSGSLLVAPSPDQPSSLLESLSQLSRPCELESSTPASAADVVALSRPELSESSQDEFISSLPASLEAPPIAPVSPHSTPPQRPPGLKAVGLVSSPLDITPAFVLSTPRLGCQAQLIYEAPSMLAPRFSPTSPPLPLSRFGLARFNSTLNLVTTVVLISALIKTIPTFARKLWNKKEDLGGSQNGAFKTSELCNISAQQLRLGQYTPRASRFVFDPGGLASVFELTQRTQRRSHVQAKVTRQQLHRTHAVTSIPIPTDNLTVFDPGGQASSSRLFSAHEDVHKRKSKIRNGFITHIAIAIPVPTDSPVFDPGGVGFVLEPAHEDLVTLDKDAQ
ncbi:hypothetical protein EDB83DRAFT_2531940 [Lactarius deliciosus]|nr:hypothetical protein EDB83DRAFT_2531940 [Lactarius deliciosus]